ncbi:MIF4G like-domain-containing protein [Protomyces lactucae-debilis]|uniref:MIF4G like-domain-containing protein n=1 Tax=Protomyces lactucae-debilis TaxID=2754530 RepID=A0A1Y2FNJ7_PROLT|nr:MIF4G like-domain-containing protein [Protomyces lactucae-debilis]ORY85538.1 MIF4G like-domain-containing protein [Protomyces lactucae-debilis]
MSSEYHGHGGRQQRKRPRDDQHDDFRRPRRADLLFSLQRDLTNLADPGGSVSPLEDIKYVGRKLAGEFEHPENKTPILELIREAVVQLSVKTCQYSAAVTLAGLSNKQFAQTIAESAGEWVQDALKRQDWLQLKFLLRFVAGLDQILQDYGVFEYLRLFATQIAGLATRSDYADALCKVVLLTLPFVASSTSRANTHRLNDLTTLLGTLEPYMQVRGAASFGKLTMHYQNDAGQAPYEQREELSMLFEQLKLTAGRGWNIRVLAHFQEHYIEAERFKLPSLVLGDAPPTACNEPVRYVLKLFVNQATETTPNETDLSGSLLRDLSCDILETCVANRKDAARFLIDIESYLPGGLFVLRGTPLDKIVVGPHGVPAWKSEDVVIEALFGELLALPMPRQKPIYYHAVLTELCKLVPQAVAPTFGRAIRQLYRTSPAMEPELVFRTWDWLSHHLSNFNFNWKWQEWEGDLTLPALSPQLVMIRETILKEVELSYHQRIRTTLPEAYHALIQEEAPAPRFTYTEGHPLAEQATALSTFLQQPQTPETLQQAEPIFKAISEASADGQEEATLIRVLVECALQLGHQSFSHALNTIEQTLLLLKQRCSVSREKQRQTVTCVMRFWRERPAVGLALLSKMVNYGIIEGSALVDWLLAMANQEASLATDTIAWETSVLGNRSILAQSAAWELLQLVFAKQATQTGQLQQRQAVLTKNIARQEKLLSDAAARAEAARAEADKVAAAKVEADKVAAAKADAGEAATNGDGQAPSAETAADTTMTEATPVVKAEEDLQTAALARAKDTLAENVAELAKVEQRIATVAQEKVEVVARLCSGLAGLIRESEGLQAWWARGLLRTVARRQRDILWQTGDAAEDAATVEDALREIHRDT